MSSTTLKRPKPKKATTKSKGKDAVKKAADVTPMARPLAEIEAEHNKVQVEWEKESRHWGSDKADKLKARLTGLSSELEVARASAIVPAKNDVPTSKSMRIKVDLIDANGNHRDAAAANPAKVVEMAKSIAALGQLEPIAVRIDGKRFRLVFGFTRLQAVKINGGEEIDAKVYPEDTTDAHVALIRAAENIHRQELNYLEEATAVADMVKQVNAEVVGMGTFSTDPVTRDREIAAVKEHDAAGGSVEALVASRLGKTVTWVRDRMYLARLSGDVRGLVAAGRLNLAHAREIAKLADPAQQDDVADMAARHEDGTGGWSLDQLRKHVNEDMLNLKVVPWQLEVPFGKFPDGKPAPACVACPFNTANDQTLFEHDPAGASTAAEAKAGLCTCKGCFENKRTLSEQAIKNGVDKAVKVVKAEAKSDAGKSMKAIVDGERPEIIRPGTFERQVKKEVTPDGKKPETTSKSSSSSSGSRQQKRTPEEIAKEKHSAAFDKWRTKSNGALADVANKSLWSSFMWELLKERCNGLYDTVPILKFIARTDVQKALAKLSDATPKDVEKLAGDLKYKPDNRVWFYENTGNVVTELAKAMGVEIDPAPKLEDFIPKDAAAESVKGGKKTDPDAEDDDDDAEEDEDLDDQDDE
jgi:ParB-like chromosome segregation protein Spo0J